ncbi:MAG: 30S ribosomal protein S1 [Deltaproteobacteria bacterium RBG_16_48_10]|nr:MAG: 30S ribosomal protein S1 [Deltaproteobacteria bacterium RBG_16_48_10]
MEETQRTSPKEQAEGSAGKELQSRNEPEDFQTLYRESLRTMDEGQILSGTVIDITPDHVTVDVGYKCEGHIPIREFQKRDRKMDVRIGDRIEVFLEKKESEEGLLILSKEKADKVTIWRDISRSYREGEVIEGEIVSKVKGGLSVDVGGVIGFLPGSQIDLKPIRNLDEMVGKRFKFRVIKLNRKRNNVVLSRRILLEEELKLHRNETLQHLQEGETAEGIVKNLTDYGAFVDLGGVDGLLHITDIAWGKIGHPSDKISVGDRIKVKVLHFDREKGKVSLGLKQTLPNPWETVPAKYPAGRRVVGKVVSTMDYGVFVELEEGVEGLVHITEMTWGKKMKHPSKIVQVGEKVEVVVLDYDLEKRRISLGMKQTVPNPWTLLEEKYPVGSRVRGRVKTVTDFGIFVGFEEGIDGLVHVSEMSWTKKIKNPGELYRKGQEIEAVVLNIDPQNERFSLGIKQFTPDPWKDITRRYRKGEVVTGKVTNVTDFGAFVELEEGIEGLVHVSEISREKVEKPSDVLKIGDTVSALVLHVDSHERRIGLSMKALKEKVEKGEIEKYISNNESTSPSLGALIQEEIERQGGELPKKE